MISQKIKLTLVLSLVGLVQYSGAQIVHDGLCNSDVVLQTDFNADKFVGQWYEIKRSASQYEDDCATIKIAKNAVASGYSFTYNGVSRNVVKTSNDVATLEDGTAKFGLNLNGTDDTDFWILKTDYDSYALAYRCENTSPSQRSVSLWILGREKALAAEIKAELRVSLDSQFGIGIEDLETVDNSAQACFVRPMTRNEVILEGQCDPNIPAVANFDANRFQGLWYEVASYYSANALGSCNRAQYTLIDGVVDVVNSQVVNQQLEEIKGTARVNSTDGSGKLLVNLEVVPGIFAEQELWILATNYDDWAVSYSCVNVDATTKRVGSWVLSATKAQSEASQQAVAEVIAAFDDLVTENYLPADQSEEACFYYPEPRQGDPVVFPGQCEDIPVVDNFDLALFQGAWNEIEAYPKEHQGGQCIRHQFTSGTGNTLNLQTTSVYDVFRDTTSGVLSFSSTDNSAKMTITTDNDIEIPFWIIATDYQNYALAYSCVNRDENFRAVYSWKLSRTDQLTLQAVTQIDNVISNVVVLDQVYYESIDQSTEGCSYLTDLTPGESVIVPRQCNPDIPVVTNFDAGRYLGRWNLIESYPSTFQDGDCNQATYSLLPDGTVEVFNTQVKDQNLETDTGIANVIPSDDGSAKLNVTFPNNPFPVEYWVLATDYDSYSLVYSCININAQDSQVLSWKPSRSKSLSNAAVNTINAAVSTVDVLNNRYYENGDNSEEACFYYPEPNPAEPVVFRGQCDSNLEAMPDFDAARYLGLWHDIESYPSVFQNGQCNNAFYSLGDSGIIDVINTQVFAQSLETQSGTAQVISDDGSAKLLVNFIVEIDGIEFANQLEYYVMDTDYETYSLVYSCQDLDDGESSQVYSWKLSRNKALTEQANARMNEVISNITVLDQRYYVPNNQSEAGCFYYPEPRQGVPVVFPGQCEDIPVVDNFNLALFQGAWNEIEAYPKEQQGGQCIRHQLTSGTGNTLNLQTTSVYDVFRDTTSGVLSFSSTDNSAKMTITTDQGIEIPFWILATDYQNYALAYSCVNRDENFRAVYSWKLSRTEQLTAEAVNEINNVISNVVVLGEVYYETIDQSTEGCSYLTDLTPGESVIVPRQCNPEIPVVTNFDAGRYLGRWNLIESYPSTFQDGDCNQATYSLLPDGTVEVFNTQVKDQNLETDTGIATVIPSDDGSAKLSVTFPNNPFPVEYWVLATDYDSYSLVYSCININAQDSQVLSWKLSRSKSLPNAAVNTINAVVSTVDVLNNRYYENGDNSEEACFYYPEFTPDQSPIFRGQCNQSIPVVPDFDVARYLGRWNDIESYPQTFQQGTCSNALYYIDDGGVFAYNTQVLDERLDTATGSIQVISDDGSAKLGVTFPIEGTDFTAYTEYWVLDTDYDNYSLVYSCANVDDDSYRVSSWKLSRTKQLSPAANEQINSIISTIPVLDERYYVTEDQSEEGCFYYPEPSQGVPVVFPNQCEDIPVVENFNLALFQGAWNEIEAYPKEQQGGQCIRHQFTSGTGNTLNMESTAIYSIFLETTRGVLSYSANDNSARMSLTFNSGGNDITIPFWILATDYDNYALAYSCVNINDTFRGVYSWKLSRTQQLTPQAEIQINDVIANVNVLDQVYYETIDQSTEACDFLPPGEDVIVPGQCDLTIPVVTNFDAARYLGRWNLVENYPSQFQDGECNEANYALLPDGTVEVYNTQVVNETMIADTGIASVVESTDGSAKLTVMFPESPVPIDYWVLATDYDSYALVYSCLNIDTTQKRIWSWKLSRTKSLSEEAINTINAVVSTVDVLNNNYYKIGDNSDAACFYYPDIEIRPDAIIELPGRCDESIRGQADFDATAYLGTWYEIERYPTGDQFGECGTAQYSAGNEVVDVINTQVVNEQLLTQEGFAVVASADGTGQLDVTFVVQGVTLTANYYVLATDYDNYALVYSCRNTQENNRIVSSWKLSRNKSDLSAQANQVISEAISRTQGLREDFYIPTGQSDTDCFYYPDIEIRPDAIIELPGRCDESIRGQADFDANAYLGTWYEIERYPTGDQFGECGTAQYSAGNEVVDVINTQVVNEQLLTQEGFAVVASADGTGQLDVTFVVQGVTLTANYYVLATDYDNYALVYSCRNTQENNRIVSSWKLSRNKSDLSAQANQVISEAISRTQGLREDFYIPTGQSDTDCFYYPEIQIRPDAIIELPGRCDESIRGQADFDATAYLGTWYEIERYPTGDQFGECGTAQYSAGNEVVDVINTQVVNEQLLTQEGFAVVASADGTGQLDVTFVVQGVTLTANYYVLATDYDNYALVYSCRNTQENNRIVSSWKLSRNKSDLSAQANQVISEAISRTQGLREDFYIPTGQSDTDCFYYPNIEVGPGSIIELPGPCPTIQAQANFNAAAYLGRWYEVRRYPTGDQFGECAIAEYSTENGVVVDVLNTQVVDERLLTQEGTAVVTSTDGTGLLEVTFNVQGVTFTANYYVLATDYDNYALVYSCRNTQENNSIVSSWQLSKQRTGLSALAIETINDYINTTQGLREDYYISTSQSDDDCFYVPEVDLSQDEDIVFRGQCEDITGVQNFDIQRYLGWWHEIERYPSSSQTAECTSSEFQASGNEFQVVDISVVDQNGVIATSTLQATTDGRLSRILSNGQTVDTWVIATDYETYSLLYSCENIDDEHRRVWSAKHSKSRQLTNAAQNAMTPLIQNNRVLRPEFYREVDQGDDACFYYPEANGEPVILPGNCDETIPVVQDFQPGDYSGTWYQIERYPQRFELEALCTGARYTVDEDTGIVTVDNWEVIDGELDVITGTATITSNDGSAKLEVVLPARGEGAEGNVTSPLYVLTTDYISYSLAYSCVNVNDFERRVGVWKLSRTRELPAAGANAINAYMAPRRELNQQYIIEVQHDDDCLEPDSGSGMVIASAIVILACMLANLFV